MLLTVGGSAAAALTLTIARGIGGDWRTGLDMWAATAVIALVQWLVLIRPNSGHRTPPTAGRRLPLSVLARTRVAWTLAIYFGCQSMVAYVVFGRLSQILTDAGMTDTAAAFQVAVAIAIGIPLAALVPPLLGRMRRPAIRVVALASCYIAAFLGLILVAGQAIWVLSALIGTGTGAFPLALTLIAMRARTSMATTSLSAFTQCVGYLIASVGPFGFGVLNGLTGGWTVPLLALCSVVVVRRSPVCWPCGRATWRTSYHRDHPRWARRAELGQCTLGGIRAMLRPPTQWRWRPCPHHGR